MREKTNYGNWDGKGSLLDIGCGAAALTVRCAKAFPEAEITAIDYWGAEWNYAKEQCEKNARAEGVADRISFQKGDAAKMEFADGTFDTSFLGHNAGFVNQASVIRCVIV